MQIVMNGFLGIAALFWLLSVGSAIELVARHPAGDRNWLSYAVNGAAFLKASNFAPSGAGAHKRFLWGFIGFFLCILCSAGVGFLLGDAG